MSHPIHRHLGRGVVIAPEQFDEFEIRARRNRPNIDFDDVRAAILANLDDLIDELIPVSSRGKTKGNEFWCCNPTRPDKNPDSFSINTRTGQWYDFANGQGGDIVRLWQQIKGLADDTAAMFDIAKFLRVPERGLQPEPRQKTGARKIVATYNYTDLDGTLLYQWVRYEPKDFRQRRPHGKGEWIWSLGGVKRVIYRWPEIIKYPDASVFLCEGEKDADRVASLGHCATTIAGDGKWTDDCVNALAGRNVFILEDNDAAGRKKSLAAAAALQGVATSIRIVRLPSLPEKGDVSNWLDADAANAGRLVEVCIATPEWSPNEESGAESGDRQDESTESGEAQDQSTESREGMGIIYLTPRAPHQVSGRWLHICTHLVLLS
jgi:DNA primase